MTLSTNYEIPIEAHQVTAKLLREIGCPFFLSFSFSHLIQNGQILSPKSKQFLLKGRFLASAKLISTQDGHSWIDIILTGRKGKIRWREEFSTS